MAQAHSGERSFSTGQQTYRSYLLRLWEEHSKDLNVWRFMLEEPQTGERLGFADLDGLVRWLQSQTDDFRANTN